MIFTRTSSLSTLLKAFTLNNVSQEIAATYNIQLRYINIQYPMLKSVEEKLGLNAKPKRPLYPFFRFMNEMRQSFEGKIKQSEFTSTAAEKWKTVDAAQKEKFEKEYKDEIVKHAIALANYRKTLTEDDIVNIKVLKENIKEKKDDEKETLETL